MTSISISSAGRATSPFSGRLDRALTGGSLSGPLFWRLVRREAGTLLAVVLVLAVAVFA